MLQGTIQLPSCYQPLQHQDFSQFQICGSLVRQSRLQLLLRDIATVNEQAPKAGFFNVIASIGHQVLPQAIYTTQIHARDHISAKAKRLSGKDGTSNQGMEKPCINTGRSEERRVGKECEGSV